MPLKVEGRVGDVGIARVYETTMTVPAAQWLPKFDRDAVRRHEHWLCPDHFDPVAETFDMPIQSFILNAAGKVVVIDTCVGNDKDRGYPAFHMLQEPYLERLAAAGLTPEDVDYVMCTHLHADHVGWNTRLLDGRWIPTFPNAKYVFSRREYDATREEAMAPDAAPYLRNCYLDSVAPVVEAGRHIFVDDVEEMLGVFTFRSTPGHSPGNMQIEMRSAGNTAVFAGDSLHSPMQIPFWQWSSITCWDQELSAAARRQLLEFCVEENALLIPGHFCGAHVGRIRDRKGEFAIEFGW